MVKQGLRGLWLITARQSKETLKVIGINSFVVLALIPLVDSRTISKIEDNYKVIYPDYFKPYNSVVIDEVEDNEPQYRYAISKFIKENAIKPALYEELKYRGPVAILSWLLPLFIFNQKTKYIIMAIIGLGLNYLWANNHTLIVPVFLAGLGFVWLTIKTRSPIPPIICHFACNVIIYLSIQILIKFQITTPLS